MALLLQHFECAIVFAAAAVSNFFVYCYNLFFWPRYQLLSRARFAVLSKNAIWQAFAGAQRAIYAESEVTKDSAIKERSSRVFRKWAWL